MPELNWDAIRVQKVREDGKPHGAVLTTKQLRGPTGDAVVQAIRDAGTESGIVTVEGRTFTWVTLADKTPAAEKE